MVELQDVLLRHGDDDTASTSTTVLERFSLDVAEGSLTVILGPSGCGKSTLLNVIAGFVQPQHGRVRVRGHEVHGPSAERGLVFQDDALMPWQDVLANVAFPLQLRGLPRGEREAQARRSLALVGLQGVEHKSIWELSGGMRQRVGLARALTADPAVLLMDEPFGALDALTRERMQELLLRVWSATGKTIVLVTHGIEEAVFLATDLVVLSRRPAQVVDRRSLDFGRRFAAGAGARQVKSDPAFIAAREAVLATVFAQEDEVALT